MLFYHKLALKAEDLMWEKLKLNISHLHYIWAQNQRRLQSFQNGILRLVFMKNLHFPNINSV